jgi:hypothetical protein
MSTTNTTETFTRLLREVDPAELDRSDVLALISLLERALNLQGVE